MNGNIELILGPMFSGKTTELLRRVERYQIAKRKCAVVKHLIDTRYSDNSIVTHSNQSQPSTFICAGLETILCKLLEYDVIAIDEGQFYPDIVESCEFLANNGKTVIVAALNGTYDRKPFGRTLELVSVSERVVKLNAVCMHCFQDAAFTKRLGTERQDVAIGGSEKYNAVCRNCFFKTTSALQAIPITAIK
jgi:thymidine kinase